MRIATWNIGEDETNKGQKLDLSSYQYIVDKIKEEEIEVICFQEAIIKSNYMPTIAEFVKNNTDLKYYIEYELSDSHINKGCRMGITICSKYDIETKELIPLPNPNLKKVVDENTVFFSHDKGFINVKIKQFNIVSGHCVPFHYFGKNILDHLDIYKNLDNKFMNIHNKNNNVVICGDFNYEDINLLIPQTMENCVDLIDTNTHGSKQLDHFIISNSLTSLNGKVFDERFDHKLAVFDIK